jgi:hypothetical protein
MDPLFVASPTETQIADALRLWPELAGKRIRPLLVTAFGDVFVETDAGDIWIASPIDLACERIAGSLTELEEHSEARGWRRRLARPPLPTARTTPLAGPPQRRRTGPTARSGSR